MARAGSSSKRSRDSGWPSRFHIVVKPLHECSLYAFVDAAYLAGRAGLPVKSLAELIEFNERNSGPGVPDQQMLTMINGMDISDEARNELWAAIGPIFKSTIDKPLAEHKLDAIVSNFHSYSYYYSAVAGYPGISIPSGMDDEGMPTAVHFYGKNLSEATLLSVAYGYEQASQAIRKPAFKPGLR